MAAGSRSESNKRRTILTTEGWRDVPDAKDQTLFVLDHSHPDYPNALQGKRLVEDLAAFDQDKQVQDAVKRIWTRLEAPLRLAHETAYVRRDPHRAAETFIEQFSVIVTEEADRAGPTKQHRRRLIYLHERAYEAFPPWFGRNIIDQLKEHHARHLAPFQVVVNPGPNPTNPQVYPHETAIILGRFPTSDLPKLGRIVTEAQVLAGQVDERGYGGRPKLPDHSHEAATPETIAKLRHWEKWSHRRIAAFFGDGVDRRRRLVRLADLDALTQPQPIARHAEEVPSPAA